MTVRRWLPATLALTGGLGLLAALFVPWYQLRLYSWQGGCCSADIDNPYYRLAPLGSDPGPYSRPVLGAEPLYFAIAVVAVVIALAGIVGRGTRIVAAGAVVLLALIAVGAVLAFDVDPPGAHGQDIIVVRMAPQWGLAAGTLAAVTIAFSGFVDRLLPPWWD